MQRTPPVYLDFTDLAGDWRAMRPDLGRVVFTNGCFDILHAGHVTYLEEARELGDFLVLGLNDDASVRRLKGDKRPIMPFADRARVLVGLASVDLVVGFGEDTPYNLIDGVAPDILVKGGDYTPDQIVGADLVQARGGQVRSLGFKPGASTTGIVETILARYQT
ncbi:D-glycero-beta-D-manno-heptose 1-phosphate adenylyltransferase [Sulfidibacter corallicola]|uniref:D-glycero-beta-D-manno-heptose 1-phosphate adenylyltransferase n=1 Tax=Sulfidibacter corallicola TaxID=2818388 RepID=A0A8A4TEH0_SULCO|nr:D-glycero-beta-D-manno-heptose 1-phosphate adenylyltransferase [Sulfidibacter corallicola]QTD47950.1 D-glycero-beta-D-manno-heptose 1-phosphate adenylyltransferase [Sulfidibacter corallicola]